MVKSLKDILKEIENKKPIVSNFANGGYGSDMGQDDTLGEDNEGSITGTEDTSGFTTDDVSYGDRGMHPSELEDITNRAMSEEEAIDFIGDASRGESRVEQMVNRDQQAYNLWGDAAVDNLENIERGLFGQVVPTTLAEAGKKVGTSILSNIAFGGAAPLVGLAYNVVEAIDRFSKESDLDKAVAESDIGKGKGKAAQAEQSLIDNASSLATADQLSMFPGLMMATEKEMADFIGLTKPDTSSGSSRPSWGDPEGYERDKFTTQVAQQLIDPDDSVVTDTLDEPVGVYENLVANLVQNRPSYTGAKSGGSIDAFGLGGLAGMMRRRPPQSFLGGGRQQLSPYHPQIFGNRPTNPFQPYPHSEPRRPTRASDSNQGGMFGGFPILGDQGSKDTQLKPETYFHEHEGGKVNYPNFPSQTGIEPANKRNPIKGVTPKPFPQPTPKQYVSEDLPSVTQEIATPLETPVAAEEEAVEQQVTQPTSINIDMPQNVTATLDFPEDVVGTPQYNYKGGNVMRYNNGGLTGLASNNPEQYNIGGFLRSILPAVAGGAAGMTGLGGFSPWLVGGLTGAATGALTGGKKDRNVLGFAKNFLMGGSGASAANIANPTNVTPVTSYADGIKKGFEGFGDNIAKTFANPNTTLSDYALPLAGLVGGMSLEQPATGGPRMTPQQMAQMSPEQQEKFLQTQRERFPYQRPTFQPPNTGINFAADGGVMEIDEEMQSGSFVLPADVVSNVGDGSSTSGHRRLAQLFGGGDDYAIGGGILKGPIKGPGGGLDDLIQTGIDGVRVARLSTDEFVVPKDVVRKIGDGSQKAGAEQLYDFMKNVRLNKHGTSQQPKGINMAGLKKMV